MKHLLFKSLPLKPEPITAAPLTHPPMVLSAFRLSAFKFADGIFCRNLLDKPAGGTGKNMRYFFTVLQHDSETAHGALLHYCDSLMPHYSKKVTTTPFLIY